MQEMEVKTSRLVLKYNGIIDFDKLYRIMYDWIVDQGYYFEEKLYKHKIPTQAGAEDHMVWSGWKKQTEYVKYWIHVYIILWETKEIEVIKNGEKKKLLKTKMQIEMQGVIELDQSKRFGGSRLAMNLKNFLNKYVLSQTTEGIIGSVWWDEMQYKLHKFHTIIKEFLDMESKGNAYYDVW